MKRYISICLLCLCSLVVAQIDGKVIETGHWVYDALYFLSLEDWQIPLTTEQPQSVAQLLLQLKSIDAEHLSPEGERVYKKVKAFLEDETFLLQKGNFGFNVNGIFDVSLQFVQNLQAHPLGEHFLRYNQFPSPLVIPLEMHITKYVSLYADITFRKNYLAFLYEKPYINLPLSGTGFDSGAIPYHAGLSIGNYFMNFHIGRGRVTKGRTISGNMLLSDTADRLDFLQASFFSQSVLASIRVVELTPVRFLFYHELTIRPVKYVSFGLQEGMSVNSVFDPRFLNPAMVLHNWAPWRDTYLRDPYDAKFKKSPIGTQLGVSLDVAPYRGLRLYGQFVMNQFQTWLEYKAHPKTAGKTPNSIGGLAGISYAHPFSFGYLVTEGEFSYASPWLYIMEAKDISWYYSRRDLNSPNPGKRFFTWLGSPYGPDTMTVSVKMAIQKLPQYSYFLQYRYIVQGEIGSIFFEKDQYYPTSIAEAQVKTPSGVPIHFHSLTIGAKSQIHKNLTVHGQTTCTFKYSKTAIVPKTMSFDFIVGMTYSIL